MSTLCQARTILSQVFSMDKNLGELLQRMERIAKNDGRSFVEISKAAGLSARAIGNTISGGHWPSAKTLLGFCQATGTEPNILLGFPSGALPVQPRSKEEVARKIVAAALKDAIEPDVSIDTVVDWFHQNGGRLEGYDTIAPYIDLYASPTETDVLLSPKWVGPQSLAAQIMQVRNADEMVAMLRKTDLNQCRKSAILHREVLAGKVEVGVCRIQETLPDGQAIDITYRRIVRRVESVDGPMILTFAKPISCESCQTGVGAGERSRKR